MREIGIFGEAIEMGGGGAWLVCLVVPAFLGWAIYLASRRPAFKPQSPAASAPKAERNPVLNQEEMKVFLGTDDFDPPVIKSSPKPGRLRACDPPRKRSPGSSLRWRSPGEMVHLQSGHRISVMIYTAFGLFHAADEPSAINQR